ncbi:pentatricopeptide repeat-containing protein, mitochondrial [Trifolium repens]|nr:pentatricopeptide repeat-containing protein, mitochondrial [Trifolium repens]
MQETGVYPDQIAYTTLITAFCNTGEMVKKLYNEMKEKGVYLDQIAYTTLIAAFCSTGEMILAQAFFDEMLREGYSPNVILYTCMINGYWKLNMIDRAKKLHYFDEMLREGYSPTVSTYTCNGYWKLNMIDQAQKAATGLSRKVLRLKSGAIRELCFMKDEYILLFQHFTSCKRKTSALLS